MKKIMLAGAVAMVAMFANAYNVTWGYSGGSYQDWSGADVDDASDCTMLLFALTGSDATISYNDASGWTMNNAQLVDHRTYDSENLAGWGSAADDPPFESTVSNLGAEKQYFQAILVEGTGTDLASLGEGKHFTNLGVVSADGEPDPTPGSTGFIGYTIWDDTTNIAKSDWATTAPEPTSGLLLLIGVAGLALKRKHA